MDKKIEYRVIPVTRYVVTRFEDNGVTGSVSERGEYGNREVAREVGYALCKAEHDASGLPPGAMNFQYPGIYAPDEQSASAIS